MGVVALVRERRPAGRGIFFKPCKEPRFLLVQQRPFLSVLLLVTCGLAMPACGSKRETPESSKPIVRAVLTYLIESQFGQKDPALLVVDPASTALRETSENWVKTWTYVRGKVLRGDSLSELRDDTCASFVKSNEESQDLSKSIDAALPVEFLRSGEFSEWQKQGGGNEGAWKRFHDRYPNAHAWISLSRPGVSDSGAQAVIWVSMGWGALGGWSGYALLERASGRWNVTGLCITEEA